MYLEKHKVYIKINMPICTRFRKNIKVEMLTKNTIQMF